MFLSAIHDLCKKCVLRHTLAWRTWSSPAAGRRACPRTALPCKVYLHKVHHFLPDWLSGALHNALLRNDSCHLHNVFLALWNGYVHDLFVRAIYGLLWRYFLLRPWTRVIKRTAFTVSSGTSMICISTRTAAPSTPESGSHPHSRATRDRTASIIWFSHRDERLCPSSKQQ